MYTYMRLDDLQRVKIGEKKKIQRLSFDLKKKMGEVV